MKSEAFASSGVVLSKLLEGANRERQKMVITDESMDVSQFGGARAGLGTVGGRGVSVKYHHILECTGI